MKIFFAGFIWLLIVHIIKAQQCSYEMPSIDKLYSTVETFIKNFENVYNKIITANGDKNDIHVPMAFYFTLVIAYYGAQNHAVEKLRRTISYPGNKCFLTIPKLFNTLYKVKNNSNVDVAVLFPIFTIRNDIVSDLYRTYIFNTFEATISDIDSDRLQFMKNTNKWIKSITNNKVTHIIKSGSTSVTTDLIFSNVVYFDGIFRYPFQNLENKLKFFGFQNRTYKVEGMVANAIGLKIYYFEKSKYNLIQLVYQDPEYVLYILLPDTNNEELFKNIEKQLLQYKFDAISSLSGRKFADLYMPKFKIESSPNIKSICEEMNLTDTFSYANNFNIIFESNIELKNAGILQVASLTVDNKKTFTNASQPAVDETIKIDKPFHFFILKNNELFMKGRVVLPVYP